MPGVKNTTLTFADMEGKEQTVIAKPGDSVMPGMKVSVGDVTEQQEGFGRARARLTGEARIRMEDGSTLSLGDQATFQDGIVTNNEPQLRQTFSQMLGLRG